MSNCNLFSDDEQDVARKPRSRRRVSTSATTRAKSRSPMRPHSLESEQHMSTPVSSKVRSHSPRRPHSVEFGRRTQVTSRDRSRSPRRPHSVEFERRICTQMTTRDRSRSPRRSCLVESAFSAPVTARDESRSPRRPQSAGPLFEILSEVKKTNSRLENFEKRLQQLEESMQTPVSSRPLTKRTVPTRVRVRWIKSCKTTEVYSLLPRQHSNVALTFLLRWCCLLVTGYINSYIIFGGWSCMLLLGYGCHQPVKQPHSREGY